MYCCVPWYIFFNERFLFLSVPKAPPGSPLATVHPPHTPLSTPSLRSAHCLRGRPAATRQEHVQRGGWPGPGGVNCFCGYGAYSREAAWAARAVLHSSYLGFRIWHTWARCLFRVCPLRYEVCVERRPARWLEHRRVFVCSCFFACVALLWSGHYSHFLILAVFN